MLGSLVSTWLPARRVPITTAGDDNPTVTVGAVGHVQLQRIIDEAGRQAAVLNAPVLGAIDIERSDLARGDGSHFADPEMRPWESGGHGSVSPFSWRV